MTENEHATVPFSPGQDVLYRQATEEDLPMVAKLYDKLDHFLHEFNFNFPVVENVGEKWLDIFRRTMGRFSVVYVAEYQGETVGFILARLKRVPEYLGGVMVGELKDMWVEPEVRRLRIGEKLLRLAIEWCWTQDVYSLEAQVFVDNDPIIQLVEYLGMKPELYQMRMMKGEYNVAV
jgi:GNAT superfamily N-acetyltransferase